MARTPSMTASEAEALLGARGYLQVNSDNRGNVRKWLCAHGLPSLYVCGLAMKALQAAYNDTTDKTLNRLKAEASQAEAEASDSSSGNEEENYRDIDTPEKLA